MCGRGMQKIIKDEIFMFASKMIEENIDITYIPWVRPS